MPTSIIKKYTDITAVLDIVYELEKEVFPSPYSKEKLMREASVKNNFTIFVAFIEDKAVGYKAGYEMTARLYYSWIGGVSPNFRNQGIAQELMDKQHREVQKFGYSSIRTHTKNTFRQMLILNIKNGFDIIGVFKSERDDLQTIMLEKDLRKSTRAFSR